MSYEHDSQTVLNALRTVTQEFVAEFADSHDTEWLRTRMRNWLRLRVAVEFRSVINVESLVHGMLHPDRENRLVIPEALMRAHLLRVTGKIYE